MRVGRQVTLGHGDLLVAEGDGADDIFLVVSGRLQASVSTEFGDVTVGTIEAGRIVGEITVIAGGRRTATLIALGAAEVLVVGRADFERWLDERPAIADAVSAQARERIDRTQVAAMVTDLMQTNDDELIQQVVDRVEWHRLQAGDTLFEQGDPSDAAYFVVGGRLIVLVRDADGSDELVREIGRTEVVGELGLLDREPRAATVRAVRDTTLAAFPSALFEELVSRSPSLMLHVTRSILSRLSERRRIADRAASLTIAVTATIDSTELIEAFVEEVARHGSVKHLSSDGVDRMLNREGIAQATVDNVGVPRLTEFMHEADVGNDYLVLEADREMTPWTQRALRQADRVVLVSSADPDEAEQARLTAVLDAIDGAGHVARMLAVLHPATADRPRGTADLLRRFPADEVVHVRVGSTADVGRLARLASGTGVGLVFSGGGARGGAHIGAYLALREAGVPIDQVAGCSMGAVIAAGIAIGTADDRLIDVAEQQFHRLLDYTLPVVSLIKGERISRNIHGMFGDWTIEDMWLPFYSVSTNLTTVADAGAPSWRRPDRAARQCGDPRSAAARPVRGRPARRRRRAEQPARRIDERRQHDRHGHRGRRRTADGATFEAGLRAARLGVPGARCHAPRPGPRVSELVGGVAAQHAHRCDAQSAGGVAERHRRSTVAAEPARDRAAGVRSHPGGRRVGVRRVDRIRS